MKKLIALIFAFISTLLMTTHAFAGCTTIQSGQLLYKPGSFMAGQPYRVGVDPYGYNYQAHSFSGSFFNVYANSDGLPPYNGDDIAYLAVKPSAVNHWAWSSRNVDVAMKWNDAWLSNQDCDGNGAFDRHYGFPSYVGSGAWLTNHDNWDVSVNGKESRASEFMKVVAITPTSSVGGPTSYFGEGTVYTADSKYVGDQIWGEFVVIQYLLNDPSTGDRGVLLKSQVNAGFGFWKP